jgi:polysaccharide biosynthesis/export protein
MNGDRDLDPEKSRSILVRAPAGALALALGALLACASPNLKAFKHTEQGGSGDEYLIGAPDVVRVTVWQHPELSAEMPVRRDGKISIPLLDDVQAAGLTPKQLKASITQGLTGNIKNPNVTVAVISPDSQTVSVIGGVAKSGPIPLTRDMGVLEAVAAAGGFTAWANKNDIVVVRWVEGKRVSYEFSYRGYLSGSRDADIFLKPGDVIVVPE